MRLRRWRAHGAIGDIADPSHEVETSGAFYEEQVVFESMVSRVSMDQNVPAAAPTALEDSGSLGWPSHIAVGGVFPRRHMCPQALQQKKLNSRSSALRIGMISV